MKNNETRIYTGNKATGYTTTQNGISRTTYSETVARRDGIIKNSVPTYALCCGWNNNKNR